MKTNVSYVSEAHLVRGFVLWLWVGPKAFASISSSSAVEVTEAIYCAAPNALAIPE